MECVFSVDNHLTVKPSSKMLPTVRNKDDQYQKIRLDCLGSLGCNSLTIESGTHQTCIMSFQYVKSLHLNRLAKYFK